MQSPETSLYQLMRSHKWCLRRCARALCQGHQHTSIPSQMVAFEICRCHNRDGPFPLQFRGENALVFLKQCEKFTRHTFKKKKKIFHFHIWIDPGCWLLYKSSTALLHRAEGQQHIPRFDHTAWCRIDVQAPLGVNRPHQNQTNSWCAWCTKYKERLTVEFTQTAYARSAMVAKGPIACRGGFTASAKWYHAHLDKIQGVKNKSSACDELGGERLAQYVKSVWRHRQANNCLYQLMFYQAFV